MTVETETETELRVYRIASGHLDDFVRAWTAGVLPLRRRYGFEIEAWVERETETFAWLVSHAGQGSFDEANARYYASPERTTLDPDPRQWIVDQQTYRLEPLNREGRS